MSSESRPRANVLVVEDEAYVRESLGALLEQRGYAVTLADGVEAATRRLGKGPADVVLTDLNMPGGGGLEVLKRTQALAAGTPVVVLTGFGTVASAVDCVKAGAADYLLKPIAPEALEVALTRALRQRSLELEVAYLRDPKRTEGVVLIGESPAWLKTLEKVRAAAAAHATVLLLGESGSGKDVLARLLHRQSLRAAGPFVEVDCASIPVEVWESEFFGHRRGAFPGALEDRHGRFHLADQGTLFVDEVGAMPVEAQAKLLRALEEGEFHRLGDEHPTRVDVRVVAATNSNLEAAIAAGQFRQDLYYRLNILRIDVPPLRERLADIPLLARRFVAEIGQRLGRRSTAIPEATLAEMQAYHWPGNVRELRSVIERSMTLDPDGGLRSLDLSPVRGEARAEALPEAGDDLNLRSALGRTEKTMVIEALRRAGSVRKEAARLLGIDQRNMGYYLRKHGIDADNPRGEE